MFVVSCGAGYGSVYTVTCPGSCMPYTVACICTVSVHIIRYKATAVSFSNPLGSLSNPLRCYNIFQTSPDTIYQCESHIYQHQSYIPQAGPTSFFFCKQAVKPANSSNAPLVIGSRVRDRTQKTPTEVKS